jgi:K(+)-stimulated pyrophosphate-energized sodium pump
VVALAGDLSEAGSRSAQAFALAVTEDVVAMLALGAAYEANTSLRSAIGLLLVPVLSRAFSVLGGAFGVFTVRTDDREDPLAALHRARLIASALHVVGLAGALEWLVPNHRGPLLGPALLGVALSFGLAWFAQYLTSPRDRPVRELADVSRGGPSFGILGGVELGLRAAVVPLAATSFAIVGALWLGMRSGMSGGAHLAMAGLIAGAAGGSTTGLALECCGGMLDGAAGLVAATTGRARREVRGRMLVLDAAGSTYRLLGRLRNASSALLLIAPTLAVLRAETVRRPTQSSSMSFEVAAAIAVPCALAGAALVAWFFARTSAATLASARRLLDEVQRQLRDRPARRTNGPMTLGEQEPADAQPCVEIASRLALQQALLGIAAVCAPIPFALGLRLVEIADKEAVAFVAAVTTLVATMIAGVLGALVASTAGGTWGNAKRYIVTGAHGGRLLVDETGAPTENPTYFAAVVADTVGDSLKDVASPAVLAYVTLLPILALALLPLLL